MQMPGLSDPSGHSSTDVNQDEAARIDAMFEQSDQQWEQTQSEMAMLVCILHDHRVATRLIGSIWWFSLMFFLCLIIGANVSPILVLVEAVQDQITRKHPQSHRRRAMSATGVDSQVDLLSIVAETHSLIQWC